ncbi:hypothetical protein SDC9_89682 [bioreactor metagenome]|uniref:Uncharacterized protein n=1 Tax=bioreactor metagenome TaxID=1076179 RepID=A0A644ZPX2_9ZZZZ
MTAGTLKEYIGNIYSLEVSLYNQRSLFKNLLDETDRLARSKGEALNKVWNAQFKLDGKETAGYAIGGACVGTLIGAFTSVPFFAGTIGGLLIALLLAAVSEYCATVRARRDNKKIEAANRQIVQSNQLRQSQARKKISILNQELDVLKKSFEETKAILDKYYSKDIVFPKYRNLPAISSIYEYLCAGRCTTLEGHEGAYNIFENEVYQKLIISKLDEVIRRLDDIAQNQHMLYQAIRESNANTQRLTQVMYNVADRLGRIEDSNEVIAHNGKIAAQNLKVLTWLEVSREISRA